jgi:hypothetical protein
VFRFLEADDNFTDFELTSIQFQNDIDSLTTIIKTYDSIYRNNTRYQ